MRGKFILFSFSLFWFLFLAFGCVQQSQETGSSPSPSPEMTPTPSPGTTPTPSPLPEITLPPGPLTPVSACEGCTRRWCSVRFGEGGVDITYRVESSATCKVLSGEPRTTYTYKVSVTGSGPGPLYFEVVLPACTTASDILSANPSYGHFGPDLPCVPTGENVVTWWWYPEYGGEKTFVLTVRGRSEGDGQFHLRLEDPLPPPYSRDCLGFVGCAPSCE